MFVDQFNFLSRKKNPIKDNLSFDAKNVKRRFKLNREEAKKLLFFSSNNPIKKNNIVKFYLGGFFNLA
jgi:hypothetical protein